MSAASPRVDDQLRITVDALPSSETDSTWAAILERSGGPVSLHHRPEWWNVAPGPRWQVHVHGPAGPVRAAFAVWAWPWRLRGHQTLRAERIRPELGAEAALAGIGEVARRVHADPKLVRFHVEIFSPTRHLRGSLATGLAELGFEAVPVPRLYCRTLIVDLTPSEEDIFAGFHPTARRHVRAVGKRRVSLHRLDDPGFAPALERLLEETMRRSGGPANTWDFRALLDLARTCPERVCIIGVCRGTDESPDGLLAFAVGLHHGDHVEYSAAGSTRADDLKVPLGYAPAWELMRWAKATGAEWFDFGGISDPLTEGGGPLDGISRFKRYFRGLETGVAEEWLLEPRPVRNRALAVVDRLLGAVRSG